MIEWTPELKAALLELTAPGHSKTFVEIATELFGTPTARNACIGMARRLRLPPAPPKAIRVDAPIAAPVARRHNGEPVTIYQLRRHDCRWPEGVNPPYLYCGRRTLEERPYCEEHCARAYGHWNTDATR